MTVYKGRNSFLHLMQSVKSEFPKRIFCVTGKKSFTHSPARDIISSLFQSQQITFFSDFSANVKFAEALAGCRNFFASGADTIIAVGGGSVIDMAKIIRVGAPDKGALLKIIKGESRIESKAKLYCAPTTAGSGSEATHFAVIYIDGAKFSLAHEKILPDSVAVDSALSASMSPYLTACSGFDALSQAIEACWAKGSTSESRKFSKQAMALVLPHICDAVHCPTIEIRDSMAEGSYLAGKAINIAKTTAPHALSYYLTANFSIPHGHAVAILLGHFFQVNEENTPSEIYAMLGKRSASECCFFWYELMKKCSLETNLSKLGVNPDNIGEMIDSVNLERLSNNPVFLSKTALQEAVTNFFT